MRILEEIYLWIEFFIRNLPGVIGRKIRYYYYKLRLAKCGKNVVFDLGVIIQNPQDVFLGNNIWIDKGVIIIAGKIQGNRKVLRKTNPDYIFKEGELHIDDNVHIAPYAVLQAHGGIHIKKSSGIASGAKIYSLSHHHSNLLDKSDTKKYAFTPLESSENQFLVLGAVVMHEKSALGLNSVILPGTIIPKETWVGVNTFIVGQTLEDKAIYATAAAQNIKRNKG